jgi:hypothetical protein
MNMRQKGTPTPRNLFVTPTERDMPAKRGVIERQKGAKRPVEKAKTVARAPEPVDGDTRKATPKRKGSVEEVPEKSFSVSDPPSWVPGRAGTGKAASKRLRSNRR